MVYILNKAIRTISSLSCPNSAAPPLEMAELWKRNAENIREEWVDLEQEQKRKEEAERALAEQKRIEEEAAEEARAEAEARLQAKEILDRVDKLVGAKLPKSKKAREARFAELVELYDGLEDYVGLEDVDVP